MNSLRYSCHSDSINCMVNIIVCGFILVYNNLEKQNLFLLMNFYISIIPCWLTFPSHTINFQLNSINVPAWNLPPYDSKPVAFPHLLYLPCLSIKAMKRRDPAQALVLIPLYFQHRLLPYLEYNWVIPNEENPQRRWTINQAVKSV